MYCTLHIYMDMGIRHTRIGSSTIFDITCSITLVVQSYYYFFIFLRSVMQNVSESVIGLDSHYSINHCHGNRIFPQWTWKVTTFISYKTNIITLHAKITIVYMFGKCTTTNNDESWLTECVFRWNYNCLLPFMVLFKCSLTLSEHQAEFSNNKFLFRIQYFTGKVVFKSLH